MKILFFLISFFVSSANAADVGVVSIAQTVTDAIHLAGADKIMPLAMMWIGSFMGIQFVITNIGLLKSGADLETVWAKFLGSVVWFGFCLYLLKNGPEFIDSVGGGILEKFAGFPKPGWIITSTLLLCTPFLAAIAAIGLVNTTLAMILMTAMLTVLAAGMMLAIKIMMLTIELGLIVMLSPLSFSLLGLNALKDQGIAPLKSLLSLIYRIVLLSVICVAFTELITVAAQNFKDIGGATQWLNPSNWPSIINTILSTVIAFPVIGYLVFKSDSIASSLAGGSSNMGTGDVASAAAAGAAAGAAMSSGGATTAAGVSNAGKSMSDFMKSMSGGGSVNNASGRGTGGTGGTGELMRPPALNSLGGAGAGGGGATKAGNSSTSKPADSKLVLSPQGKNALNVQNAAMDAGASPSVIKAVSNAAYLGGSSKEIEAAAVQAGGTQAQGQAAGAASTGVGGPDWNMADKPIEALSSSSGSTAALIGSTNSPVTAQQGGYKKTGLDHLSNTNNHIAQENAATHVSINANQSD